MHYKHFLLLSIIVGFMACGPKPEKLETPVETIVKVLADVHLAEGALLSIHPKQKDSLRDLYYHQIYEIHEVAADAFERDLKILKMNPEMMEDTYEKVLEELNRKEADLQGKEIETKK